MRKPCFYMPSYLIDDNHSPIPFHDLGWNWDLYHPPVHVYCYEIWDIKYKSHFYEIFDHLLSPLYTIIFGFLRYRISSEAREGMKGIVDWYLGKYYSYVRVYGTTESPHILPYFIPDLLLMREITHQTIRTWVSSFLMRNSKNLRPFT
jgi:hypothetical protein